MISARACVQIRIYVFRHVARLFEVEGEAEMEKKKKDFLRSKAVRPIKWAGRAPRGNPPRLYKLYKAK